MSSIDFTSLVPNSVSSSWKTAYDSYRQRLKASSPSEPLPKDFATELRTQIRDFTNNHPQCVKLLATWKQGKSLVLNKSAPKTKDIEKAKSFREEGNKHFCASRDREAVALYTESLAYAPRHVSSVENSRSPAVSSATPPSPAALALANRSAALLNLGKPIESLADIDASIALGYAPAKLYLRRAMALQSWEASTSVLDAFDVAISISRKEDEQKTMSIVPGPMEEKAQMAKDKYLAGSKTSMKTRRRQQMAQTEYYESDKISIREGDKNAGKSILALKEISAGTVIFWENPFACVLSKEFKGTRCENCFRMLGLAKIACRSCAESWYCSSTCEAHSWILYHFRECNQGWATDLGQAELLCVRAYYQCNRSLPVDGCGSSDASDTCAPSAFIALRHHIFEHSAADLFRYLITAILIRKALGLNEVDEILLMETAGRLRCNGFGVKSRHVSGSEETGEDNQNSNGVEDFTEQTIGTAVYLHSSALNHSCTPGALAIFGPATSSTCISSPNFPSSSLKSSPTTICIRTTREHLPSEEICISYGPVATQWNGPRAKGCFAQARKERQEELLRKYFFACACDGCKNAESLQVENDKASKRENDLEGSSKSSESEQENRQFRIHSDVYKCDAECRNNLQCDAVLFQDAKSCPKCKTEVDLIKRKELTAKAFAHYQLANDLLSRSNGKNLLREASNQYIRCTEILVKFHHPMYSRRLGQAYDSVAETFARLAMYKDASEYCERSIEIVENVFGRSEIQTVRERFKLCTILFNSGQPEKTYEYVQKTLRHHRRLFGDQDPGTVELLQMHQILYQTIDKNVGSPNP